MGSSVTSVSIGDNVLISYTSCGSCSNCKAHHTSYCKDWEPYNFGVGRLDGSKAYSSTSGEPITSHFFGQSSMARHCVTSERSVVKVPADAPLELFAPLGCGIMTGAGAMLNVVKPNAHSSVAVVGAGAVGLAAIMAAKLAPERPEKVIAVDVVPSRLEMAKKYGATHVINSKEQDLKTALLKITNGEGVSGSIDCTGRPEVVSTLIDSTAKRGITVTVGVGKVRYQIPYISLFQAYVCQLDACASANMFNTVNNGRTYTGCCMGSCYPQEFIPMLVEASKCGDFPFTELVKSFPVGNVEDAVKATRDGSVVKSVIAWE